MTIISYLGPCLGITIFRFGKWTCQLWKIPHYYNVEEHKHSDIDVRILYLYGEAFVSKAKNGRWHECFVSWPSAFFKRFRIRPNEIHKILNLSKNLWLLTLQKYVGQKLVVETVEQNFERT